MAFDALRAQITALQLTDSETIKRINDKVDPLFSKQVRLGTLGKAERQGGKDLWQRSLQAWENINIMRTDPQENTRLSLFQWYYLASLYETMTGHNVFADETAPEIEPFADQAAAMAADDTEFQSLRAFLDKGHGNVFFVVRLNAELVLLRFRYLGTQYTKYPDEYAINLFFNSELANAVHAKPTYYHARLNATGGLFVYARNLERPRDYVARLLRLLQADPIAGLRAFGEATGACGFCRRELTDEPSVAAGYGPVCAEKYGLPWGEAKVTLTRALPYGAEFSDDDNSEV